MLDTSQKARMALSEEALKIMMGSHNAHDDLSEMLVVMTIANWMYSWPVVRQKGASDGKRQGCLLDERE